MKKNYTKPELKTREIIMEPFMQASQGAAPGTGGGDGQPGPKQSESDPTGNLDEPAKGNFWSAE